MLRFAGGTSCRLAVLDGNRGGLPCKLKLQEVESVRQMTSVIPLANLVFIVTVLVSTPRIATLHEQCDLPKAKFKLHNFA